MDDLSDVSRGLNFGCRKVGTQAGCALALENLTSLVHSANQKT